jgi:peptidylprolyl isomerase/peptidyl-prolyl cis-trans isomerase D
VIRIDEQRNIQKGVKMVTFGREIVPSQETENTAFLNAEKFALEISSNGKNFYDVVKDNSYQSKPAVGLRIMDERVPGILEPQRQIVTWAFGSDTKVGSIQRFDVDNGYVVAMLTNKTKKGLVSATKAINRLKPKLLNEKKAAIIKEKMTGASLNDIATANNVSLIKIDNTSLKSPSVTGVGSEPKVIGAMYYAKENQLYTKVVGDKGVFAFVLSKKEKATSLPNYDAYRQRIAQERKNKVSTIFNALKNTSDVQDNRAAFHGVQ